MRQRYVVALAVVAFIVVGMIVYSKILDSLTDDETRIRNVIATITDSMAERGFREISRHVHADFTADFRVEGCNMDRPMAMAILRRVFLTYPIIRVKVRDVSVEIIDETTATARFVATARAARSAGSREEDILQQHRGSERFLLTFKKEDGDWKIIRSQDIKSTAD